MVSGPKKWFLLFGLILLVIGGCAHTSGGYFEELLVFPIPNEDVADLKAHDIVVLMRQAGFSDQQILDLGTELRNNLATTGAAKIRTGEIVEAIYAVRGKYVHAASRRRGSFVFDLDRRHLI